LLRDLDYHPRLGYVSILSPGEHRKD
jgi:hypothetical protein